MRFFFLRIWVCFFSLPVFAQDAELSEDVQEALAYTRSLNIVGYSHELEFHEILEGRVKTRSLQPFSGYRILLISGFLSDFSHFANNSRLAQWVTLKNRFQDQRQFLRDQGLEYDDLDIESEASIEENALLIRDYLLETKTPIIILSHSKGSLDSLEAFIQYPEIQKKVAGWISLQTPFHGSPAADWSMENWWVREPARRLLGWFGGSIASLNELTTTHARNYLAAYEKQIDGVLDEIPTLCFGSYKPEIDGQLDTPLEPFFRDWLLRRGIKSDGVVPLRSSVLPGSDYVLYEGMDHYWGFKGEESSEDHGIRMMHALFNILENIIAMHPAAHPLMPGSES